ncbi:SOS response-associated peptidase [Ottowia thiooxydans]|uniref:SOS response-associated peptidase n=1 Tax=Ottowia thiooxydans TaxID=219182 RepID=UPI0004236DFC|nr:SOS response-associated peptidase family protein [Ottowia thiooxydans]
MCNRYVTPEEREIEDLWHIGGRNQPAWDRNVFPRGKGVFLRRSRDDAGYSRELAVGQWGLIPWFAEEPKLKYSTNNARSEELDQKSSYKDAWKRGQRCIIPARNFDEPNWETGKNVWWTFARKDGLPWGLAGIFHPWLNKATGEYVESYSMLTVNADAHPLMSRMHKPDPKLAPDKQDKRSVISIELEDVDLWLCGTIAQVKPLLRPPTMEVLEGVPAQSSV